MTTHVPGGTSGETVDGMRAREAAHTRELAAQGHVLRLWRPPLAPGEWRTRGLFAAADADELERVLASMPLRVWRSDEIKPLTDIEEATGARDERNGQAGRVPVTIDGSLCIAGCTLCVDICPTGAVTVNMPYLLR